jgi:hypothetical protein
MLCHLFEIVKLNFFVTYQTVSSRCVASIRKLGNMLIYNIGFSKSLVLLLMKTIEYTDSL